jgi:sulfoacetaldehyde dehydrogenase
MDIIDDKSVGVIAEYPEREIVVLAKPVGRDRRAVALHQPGSDAGDQGDQRGQGRNSIIIAPHPRAKLTNKAVCDRCARRSSDGARRPTW